MMESHFLPPDVQNIQFYKEFHALNQDPNNFQMLLSLPPDQQQLLLSQTDFSNTEVENVSMSSLPGESNQPPSLDAEQKVQQIVAQLRMTEQEHNPPSLGSISSQVMSGTFIDQAAGEEGELEEIDITSGDFGSMSDMQTDVNSQTQTEFTMSDMQQQFRNLRCGVNVAFQNIQQPGWINKVQPSPAINIPGGIVQLSPDANHADISLDQVTQCLVQHHVSPTNQDNCIQVQHFASPVNQSSGVPAQHSIPSNNQGNGIPVQHLAQPSSQGSNVQVQHHTPLGSGNKQPQHNEVQGSVNQGNDRRTNASHDSQANVPEIPPNPRLPPEHILDITLHYSSSQITKEPHRVESNSGCIIFYEKHAVEPNLGVTEIKFPGMDNTRVRGLFMKKSPKLKEVTGKALVALVDGLRLRCVNGGIYAKRESRGKIYWTSTEETTNDPQELSRKNEQLVFNFAAFRHKISKTYMQKIMEEKHPEIYLPAIYFTFAQKWNHVNCPISTCLIWAKVVPHMAYEMAIGLFPETAKTDNKHSDSSLSLKTSSLSDSTSHPKSV